MHYCCSLWVNLKNFYWKFDFLHFLSTPPLPPSRRRIIIFSMMTRHSPSTTSRFFSATSDTTSETFFTATCLAYAQSTAVNNASLNGKIVKFIISFHAQNKTYNILFEHINKLKESKGQPTTDREGHIIKTFSHSWLMWPTYTHTHTHRPSNIQL